MFFAAEHLASFGSSPALYREDGSFTSYLDLNTRIGEFSERIGGRGLFALKASNSERCIVAYLAALRAGCPVLFDTGDPHPFTCRFEYDPETDDLKELRSDSQAILHPELALLLSTSGSTGAAKSVRLSHRNLDSNAVAIAEYLGLSTKDIAPTNLPLSYSYGLSVVHSHLAAGGALLLTQRTVLDPEFWLAFARVGCTGLAGVPYTYDLLEASPPESGALASLRYATQAGGKLAPERVARWAERGEREGWSFVIMYGQTEASPRMAYLPASMARDHPDCIGRPIPGGRFRLIGDDGAEISQSEVTGELIYAGPNVMMGYATTEADLGRGHEIHELATGDLALRTSEDLYRIVGRRSRFIKPFGLRVSLEEVEARLHARGLDAACSAGPEESLVVLAVLAEVDIEALRQGLSAWLGIPRTVIAVASVGSIPRRSNGKVDTTAVREMAASLSLSQADASRTSVGLPADAGGASGDVLAIFVSKFGSAAQQPGATYRTLGGDSLSYIEVMLCLEQLLPDLPPDWDTWTVAELDALADPTTEILSVYRQAFGEKAADGGASLASLGGGATAKALVLPVLQAALSRVPADWPNMSIGALTSLAAEQRSSVAVRNRPAYRPTNLDTVRGLACLLVVALHVLGVRAGQGLDVARPSVWHAVMDALDVVRLPLFTAMAGYIYGAMPAVRGDVGGFLRTKFSQLAVPALFATLVFWLLKIAVYDEADRGFLETLWRGYEHLWYIYSILFMFCVVAVIDGLIKPSALGWLALAPASMLAYWAMPSWVMSYIRYGLLLLPFFLVGVSIQRRSDWIMAPTVTILAAACLAGSIAVIPLGTVAAINFDTSGLVTWVGGMGALVLLLRYMPKIVGLEGLAAYSFTIYLWHPAAAAAVRIALGSLGIHQTGLLFLVGLLVGVGGPVLLHIAAQRLPRMFSTPLIGR